MNLGVAPSFITILSNKWMSLTSAHLEAIPGKPQLLAWHCQEWLFNKDPPSLNRIAES